ncbi:MAG: hypothetical protein K8S23_15735 [Candidatus Cloacimonetes bacterium]|nr:hypothetical protein [Candidatus Cloacimonadota bacterium]
MLSERINISDAFEVDLSKISTIGEIIEIKENSLMFCFTLGLRNGSFKNICLHYDEMNKNMIEQKAIKIHQKINKFIERNNRSP